MSVSSVDLKECDNAHDGERWYAVQTLQYAEKRAQAQLEQQKFRTFLPKRRKTIRHARKLSTVTAAFFPGYLPCPVPAGIIETMLALADAEGLLQLSSNLKVGAPVRFAAGPFAEQLGVIDRLDNAGRIRVLLNILGRQVPVRLNRNYALPAA
jgi:transcription antitermination factor NusG